MSDFLSSISSSGSSSQLDLLVQSYKSSQQPRVNALIVKRDSLTNKKSFYDGLYSRVTTMMTGLDRFDKSDIAQDFITRKTTSSDSTIVTASADYQAILGSSSVKVERLARNDVLISDRLTLADDFKAKAGDYSFDLTVGDETFTVDVTLSGEETAEQAMTKIVNAVNSVEGITVNAALVKDTPDTGRITFTSAETGGDNRIRFSEKGNGILKNLGFKEGQLKSEDETRVVAGDATAGYVVADYSELNSIIVVNGVQVTRNTNTINDALSGVTLNLAQEQDEDESAIQLKTEVGLEEFKSLVEPLLNKFNSLTEFLYQNKSNVRREASLNTLQYTLRNLYSTSLTDGEDGRPQYLSEIGISIDSATGKLSITDEESLREALEDDPSKVSDLFLGENGFVSKLEEAVERFHGSEGLVKSRSLSLNDQIDRANDRIEEMEGRIDAQAAILYDEYKTMLQLYLEQQSQYSMLSSYSSMGGGELMYY